MSRSPLPYTPIADQLRAAIRADDRTPYAISKAAGLPHTVVNRFLDNPGHELKLDSVERLGAVLGLRLVPVAAKPGRKRRD